MLDNPIPWVEMIGTSTGSWGSILVANLYGKDESEQMQLKQQDVNGAIAFISKITHPKTVGGIFGLESSQLSLPVLNMSVSDQKKRLLLACPEFIPMVSIFSVCFCDFQ